MHNADISADADLRVNNSRALKMHNPENWIICKPCEQAPLVQRLLKLSENFNDHCTHH